MVRHRWIFWDAQLTHWLGNSSFLFWRVHVQGGWWACVGYVDRGRSGGGTWCCLALMTLCISYCYHLIVLFYYNLLPSFALTLFFFFYLSSVSCKGSPESFTLLTLYMRRPPTDLPCTSPCHRYQEGSASRSGSAVYPSYPETLRIDSLCLGMNAGKR